MKISTRPMEDHEFEWLMSDHVRRASAERAQSDRLSLDEATQHTRRQLEALLPQGWDTPGHEFLVLLDDTGEPVGHVWLFAGYSSTASLYDLYVMPEHRRRGVGRAALSWVEALATDYGCTQIWLNVVGHNRAARRLYEAAGYETAAVHMVKFADAACA